MIANLGNKSQDENKVCWRFQQIKTGLMVKSISSSISSKTGIVAPNIGLVPQIPADSFLKLSFISSRLEEEIKSNRCKAAEAGHKPSCKMLSGFINLF